MAAARRTRRPPMCRPPFLPQPPPRLRAAPPSGGDAASTDDASMPQSFFDLPVIPADPSSGMTERQLATLAAAHLAGARKNAVQATATATGLSRERVLAWFKQIDKTPPAARASALEAYVAAGAAGASRDTALKASADAKATAAAAPRPEWSPRPEHRRLGAAALATLDRVYEASSGHPDDAVLTGLWDLHRVPRGVAADYFASRRAADGVRGRGGGGRGGGGRGGGRGRG